MTYLFESQPFEHQLQVFEETRAMDEFALLWEQGTGKTKPIIDTAAWQFEEGLTNTLVVVAPETVHRNWLTDEIPAHLPGRLRPKFCGHVYDTGKVGTNWHQRALREVFEHPGLSLLTMTDSAVRTPRGFKTICYFLERRPCLLTVDESTFMKAPGSKIGKRMVPVGRRARYKRVLNGTPVPNGPFDIYQQMKFLDEDFWKPHGFGSFSVFKNYFGNWETKTRKDGATYDVLLDYSHLDELYEIIRFISSRLLKEDVLDLPDKLYSKRYYSMGVEQERVYRELRDEFTTTLEGHDIFAPLAIVRMMRLHQASCNYLPVEKGEPVRMIGDKNPRLELLRGIARDLPHKAIIWCRFTKDIDLIGEMLDSEEKTWVRFDGSVKQGADRDKAKRAFQHGSAQFLVGNPKVGGKGLTFTSAKTVIYYSQDFNFDTRSQSEDRAHRIGQSDPVHYIDLIGLVGGAKGMDDYIVEALKKKHVVAARVLGDRVREWL